MFKVLANVHGVVAVESSAAASSGRNRTRARALTQPPTAFLSGEDPEAKQAFLALVCSNQYKALDPPAPPQPSRGLGGATFVDPYASCKASRSESRFLAEGWTRTAQVMDQEA